MIKCKVCGKRFEPKNIRNKIACDSAVCKQKWNSYLNYKRRCKLSGRKAENPEKYFAEIYQRPTSIFPGNLEEITQRKIIRDIIRKRHDKLDWSIPKWGEGLVNG